VIYIRLGKERHFFQRATITFLHGFYRNQIAQIIDEQGHLTSILMKFLLYSVFFMRFHDANAAPCMMNTHITSPEKQKFPDFLKTMGN